jgi:hypothetical protein
MVGIGSCGSAWDKATSLAAFPVPGTKFSRARVHKKKHKELVGVPFAASNKTPDLQALPRLLFPHSFCFRPIRRAPPRLRVRVRFVVNSRRRGPRPCPPQHSAVFGVACYLLL